MWNLQRGISQKLVYTQRFLLIEEQLLDQKQAVHKEDSYF